MNSQELEVISMVCANFGNGVAFDAIFDDWIKFLGGKPAEVVVVDGGSDQVTQEAYLRAYREKRIDKLQLIHPDHSDNDKDKCVLQEHTVALIASKPYLLWIKIDTLPFRIGHESWLTEALSHLDRANVFCISGSFNKAARIAEDELGWYRSQHASINFCLMKRDLFVAALEEYAGEYISSGFKTTNPGTEHGTDRFVIETAFRAFMLKHNQFALVRYEDDSWSVFHTNIKGVKLLQTRERYLKRVGVRPFFNSRHFTARAAGCYYGQPLGGFFHELRCLFGPKAWVYRVGTLTGLGRSKKRSALAS